jgi:predicted nucleic acid-binding protein
MTSDRVVVSNAGPLMALSKLNLLHLLKELYGFVHVPRSV